MHSKSGQPGIIILTFEVYTLAVFPPAPMDEPEKNQLFLPLSMLSKFPNVLLNTFFSAPLNIVFTISFLKTRQHIQYDMIKYYSNKCLLRGTGLLPILELETPGIEHHCRASFVLINDCSQWGDLFPENRTATSWA